MISLLILIPFVWYLFPARFNSRVIAVDLRKTRNSNWTQLWLDVIMLNVIKFGEPQLADQDVLNALIVTDPKLVYRLPCNFNYELNEAAIKCLDTIHNIKVNFLIFFNVPNYSCLLAQTSHLKNR